jgi:Holliday junction DNA helicase RuvA
MIGFLRGAVAAKAPPLLTLDVGGVGYELEAPMSTFYTLPPAGETVQLLTHLVIREDAHVLYGFSTEEERRLFRNLLRVSGVGPKIALAILSSVTVEGFMRSVQNQDTASLTRIPGVGRKTAERLIVEMRDRVITLAPAAEPGRAGRAAPVNAENEAFSALIALGYSPAEATRLVRAVGPGELTVEELIRRALQGAAREA